jgi:hypothetical protein
VIGLLVSFVFRGISYFLGVLGGIRYDGIAYITRLFAVLFTWVVGWSG